MEGRFRYAAHITDSVGYGTCNCRISWMESKRWSLGTTERRNGKLTMARDTSQWWTIAENEDARSVDVSCEYQNAFTGKAITTAGEAVKTVLSGHQCARLPNSGG